MKPASYSFESVLSAASIVWTLLQFLCWLLIALLVVHFFAPAAQAATLGVHTFSLHAPARPYQNNDNFGVYVRHNGWMLGSFRNTLNRQSTYLGYVVPLGPFEVLFAGVTGYQRRIETKHQAVCDDGSTPSPGQPCLYELGFSRHRIAPVIAPSITLPSLLRVTPRIWAAPGIGRSSTVVHLSIEAEF
jgi:hypothetical protein